MEKFGFGGFDVFGIWERKIGFGDGLGFNLRNFGIGLVSGF